MSRTTAAKLVIGIVLVVVLLYTLVRLDAWYATRQIEQGDPPTLEAQS